MHKKISLSENLSLFLILFFFIILATIRPGQLKYPISEVDENLILIRILGMINHNTAQVGFLSRCFNIFGVILPGPFAYHGCIEHYLYLPFFKLFGLSHISSRFAAIFFNILVILFTFYFVKRLFNKTIALISSFLLAANIYFILGMRFALVTGSISQVFMMASLLILLNWKTTQKKSYFLMGLFFIGLGLSTRLWFIWFTNALLIAVIMFKKEIVPLIFNRNKVIVYALLGLIGLSLGSFLFLSDIPFIVNIIHDSFPITHSGNNNLSYFHNLFIRINQFIELLNGRHILTWFTGICNYDFVSKDRNSLYPILFFICFLWLCYDVLFIKKEFRNGKFFLLFLFVVILAQSPFTVAGFHVHHLYILLPLPQIIIAVGAVSIYNRFKNKISFVILIILFTILISKDLTLINDAYSCLFKYGGRGDNSDAIYKLVKWFDANGNTDPIILDRGISPSIIFLSLGRHIPKGYVLDPEEINSEKFAEYIQNRKSRYIFHSPEFTQFDYYMYFKDLASKSGKKLVQEAEISQTGGKVIYQIYSLE